MAKKNPEITEAAPTNGLESFLQTRGRATVDTGAAWFRTWPANAQADLRTLCLKPGQADLQVRFAGDPATKPEDPATKALLGLMTESDAFDGANGTDSMTRMATALEEHARRARTAVNPAIKALLEAMPINAAQANQSVFNALRAMLDVEAARATMGRPPARKNEADIQAKLMQARRAARDMLNYIGGIFNEARQAPSQFPLIELMTASTSDADLETFLAVYSGNQILVTLAEAENHRKELLKPPAAPEPAHALYRGIEGQMFGIDGAAQKDQQEEVVHAALRAVFTTHFDSLQKRDGSRLGAAFARLRAGKPDEIIHKIPFFQGMEINSTEQQIEERLTQQNVSNANIAKAIAIIQESAQASFQWKPEIRDGMRAPLERFMRRLESILAARMTAEYMGQQNVNPPQGMAKIIAAWHKSVTGAQQRPEDALRAIGGGPAATPAAGGTPPASPATPAEGGGGGTAAGTAAAVAAEGAVGAAAGGIFNRVRTLLPGGNSVAGQLKNQARRAARRRGGNNPY